MYLDNPRAAERDNQNSLRKFPFADASSCGNGACVIPPGALLDAQLYVPGRTAGRVWLSLVDSDGRLHFSDAAGEFAVTVQGAQPLSAVPVSFTGDGGPLPGGVVVFGRAADVAALLQAGRQAFTAAQTELAAAAVTFTGSRGVLGFKLDDGHTVWGAVKMKGANGCDVATYEKDGVRYLRISAVGQVVSTDPTTSFIARILAESDNSNFVIAPSDLTPNRIIQILPTGAYSIGDDDLPSDQEDACAAVKKARGTLPSGSATVPPDCGGGICDRPTTSHTITLRVEGAVVGTLTLLDGSPLGTVTPPTRDGYRFTGYYKTWDDEDITRHKQYFRTDGAGVGRFNDFADITLDARWIAATSEAEASFDGYGSLHLLAPDAANYSNPLRISNGDGIVPNVRTMTQDELAEGGSEALADLVLHPAVPAGEVRLSLRGLKKAFDS